MWVDLSILHGEGDRLVSLCVTGTNQKFIFIKSSTRENGYIVPLALQSILYKLIIEYSYNLQFLTFYSVANYMANGICELSGRYIFKWLLSYKLTCHTFISGRCTSRNSISEVQICCPDICVVATVWIGRIF